MQSYKDLIVWQRSIQLVTEVYKLTEKFPKVEMFGLTSQMQRAAVSIPANIAEGYARKHRPEYAQFLRIAFGSGAELETFFVLTQNLRYVKPADIVVAQGMLDEVMRMLNKLISTLVAKP
ncbi:MAG: four helix bundle protein [bacterium]|nr:four helix bundle protein [bacterium]